MSSKGFVVKGNWNKSNEIWCGSHFHIFDTKRKLYFFGVKSFCTYCINCIFLIFPLKAGYKSTVLQNTLKWPMVQLYLCVFQLYLFRSFCIFLLKIHYFLMLLVVQVASFAIIVLSLKRSNCNGVQRKHRYDVYLYAIF